jgi:hypothetical protein
MRPWLDVHVLVSSSTHPFLRNECLRSIKRALAQTDYPVAVHYLRGYPGALGVMRHQGYSCGSSPYVSSIDDDDLLFPDAFMRLKDALQHDPDAIFPMETEYHCRIVGNRVITGEQKPGRQRHSFKTFRRVHLIDHRSWRWAGDVAQLTYLETLPNLIDISQPCYAWRVYPTSNSMPLRMRDPLELRQARAGTAPLLYPPQ